VENLPHGYPAIPFLLLLKFNLFQKKNFGYIIVISEIKFSNAKSESEKAAAKTPEAKPTR
jgi:hypothetical protein